MPELPLDTLREIDPKFMEALGGLDDLINGDGALPRKVKLLIAILIMLKIFFEVI
jgi:alkylhydroperoxidase/carboxymuconolactone decarboxylase family protein YurZ